MKSFNWKEIHEPNAIIHLYKSLWIQSIILKDLFNAGGVKTVSNELADTHIEWDTREWVDVAVNQAY